MENQSKDINIQSTEISNVLCAYRKVKFDHFDKAFCVMKFTGEHCNSLTQSPQKLFRVDLIVVPAKQYHCALLSWTGSKVR